MKLYLNTEPTNKNKKKVIQDIQELYNEYKDGLIQFKGETNGGYLSNGKIYVSKASKHYDTLSQIFGDPSEIYERTRNYNVKIKVKKLKKDKNRELCFEHFSSICLVVYGNFAHPGVVPGSTWSFGKSIPTKDPGMRYIRFGFSCIAELRHGQIELRAW